MNAKLNALVHARWFETHVLIVIILAGVLTGLETSSALVARYGTLLEALYLSGVRDRPTPPSHD